MRLYHGTTLNRAKRIQLEGFQSLGSDELLEEISFLHSIPIGELRIMLQDRFAMADNRDGLVCFTEDFGQASSYAQRAPEIQWEALTQIYRKCHDLGREWNLSDELHWWVTKQMMNDPPVVIEIDTNSQEMNIHHGGLWNSEYRYPTPFFEMHIVEIHRIPRWIDDSLLRFIAGFETSEVKKFASMVKDGHWGGPVAIRPMMGRMWSLEDVIGRCSVERKIELGLSENIST